MPFPSRWPWVPILCQLGLAACAGGATGDLAGQPGLFPEVKRYYDRYAMERGGLCGTPQFDLVTRSSVEEQSADRLIVQVSYAYSQPNVMPTWGRPYPTPAVGTNGHPAITQPGAKGPSQCRGFSTRQFTIAKRADGFDVLTMTGPQRRGIKINKIDDSKVW
jgi:hypothetical protein